MRGILGCVGVFEEIGFRACEFFLLLSDPAPTLPPLHVDFINEERDADVGMM
jgi:hypothetical protein